MFHARSREAVQILDDAKDSVSSLALSEHEIVTGSVDGNLRCYDLRIGQLRTDCIDEPVTSVSMTHDSNCLLASSLDGTIRLFDKLTGDLLSEFTGHKNSVSITTREGAQRRRWGRGIHLISNDSSFFPRVKPQEFKVDSALSHNDAVVASGSEDGSIYLWDLVCNAAVF
jgi:mitogen-activated protein kinase organizer 1